MILIFYNLTTIFSFDSSLIYSVLTGLSSFIWETECFRLNIHVDTVELVLSGRVGQYRPCLGPQLRLSDGWG